MRVCAFCLMPNHWHLVLWPAHDGELARFMQKLTVTHVRRWLEYRHRVGQGGIYQGRYKSFPPQDDAHFTTVVRYVERNPVRANVVRRAEAWRWSSLGQKLTDKNAADPACAVAGAATNGLGAMGERAADVRRGGRRTALPQAQPTVRRRCLDNRNGGQT